MYTCRTCKLLKHSQAEKDIHLNEDGSLIEYNCKANCAIDIISEWHCPYFWWSVRPENGFGCVHWQNFNGKHWI